MKLNKLVKQSPEFQFSQIVDFVFLPVVVVHIEYFEGKINWSMRRCNHFVNKL